MSRFRFFLLIAGVIAAYGALTLNLYQLQIENNELYASRAEAQSRFARFLVSRRGNIYLTDRGKAVPVAINKAQPLIFAVPQEIEDVDKAVENLGPILNLEPEELRRVLTSQSTYKPLTRQPTAGQITKVKELGLPGVFVENQDKRFYPFDNLSAHVLGFVAPGDDDLIIGRYGLEKYYDDLLNKKDLTLTLDRPIQAEAERLLKELVTKHQAKGGTIIVQEPKTGKILALANQPDFNLNHYGQTKIEYFTNPTIQAVYEPGSTFKIITMAAGIDSGKLTPETTFYDTGQITFKDGKVIKNWDKKANGLVTMTNVIERSINTGAAWAEKQLGHKNFYQYLKKFGFDQPTNITLPGELAGNIKNLEKVRAEIDFAAASFGQGVAITPLQLVSAFSAIANRGMLMRPYLVSGDVSEEIRQVISPETAQKVTRMMTSAVRKATLAQVPQYTVAGKTGTAQIPDLKKGGYTDEVINSFVGFAPASNPSFTALIKIDRPLGAPLSGQTVVPAFRQLAQFILNYYNIPPDDLAPEKIAPEAGSLNY